MSTSSLSLPSFARGRSRLSVRALRLPRPELLALLVLAALLDLWALDRNGFANEYYSGAVRSMSSSWDAFLYGSFDAAGIMTVDKPPLALWVQALSVKVFGFSSWSMLAPQALMGVATVGLAYDMTRRVFGRPAGFAAGLALALTPVAVALSRHNNPDALLTLCSAAAVWCLVRGLTGTDADGRGRTKWLVLCGICIGLGFEAKMAAALLVVPACAAAWLWIAPRGRLTAVKQLLAGGAAMSAVALAWPVLIWLTPADQRPWVSGTSDNSIWSLIFGYNGLGRLFGQDGGPGGGGGGPGGGGGGPGGGVFGGEPGVLRLFNQALGGQAAWLLGFALISGVVLLVLTRLKRDDPRSGWLIAVGGVFGTMAVAFSQAEGIFHPYYVVQLAPFTAALAGAGVGVILQRGLGARILAPLAIAAGVVCELAILRDNPGQLEWLVLLLPIVGAGAAAALAFGMGKSLRAAIVAVAFGVLLLAPASWSMQTLGHATSGTFPAGGPMSTEFGGGPGGGAPPRIDGGAGPAPGFGGGPPVGGGFAGAGGPGPGGAGGPGNGNSQSLAAAVQYVRANGGGTVVVASQSGAAGQLITDGADVAAIGGFSGRESQVSIAWLADAVEDGRVRWVLADGSTGGMRNDGRIGASEAMAAVAQVGDAIELDSASGSSATLYDMQGKADALRALL